MTTIYIQKHNKNLIKEYGNGTYDEIINQLIKDVGEYMPIIKHNKTPKSTIRLKQDTINILNELKLYPDESYESVILRLLILSKNINTMNE